MKTSHCSCLLVASTLLALMLFSGCGGGGGGQPGGGRDPGVGQPGGGQDPGGGQPGGGQDPGGIDWDPTVVDEVLNVNAKGRVVTNRGQSLPGVSVSVTSGGRMISEDVTDDQGVYHVRLRRSQHNAVRASRIGFDFEPRAILVNPRQPEVLRDIKGTPRPVAIPGARPIQVDDPVGLRPALRPVLRPAPIAAPTPRSIQRPQQTPTPTLRPVRFPVGQP